MQLATDLLGKGYTVVAAIRNPDGASQLKSLEHGDRLHLVRLDVADSSTIASSVDEIKAAGISHLDVSWALLTGMRVYRIGCCIGVQAGL